LGLLFEPFRLTDDTGLEADAEVSDAAAAEIEEQLAFFADENLVLVIGEADSRLPPRQGVSKVN
jgi:hypothetical protein